MRFKKKKRKNYILLIISFIILFTWIFIDYLGGKITTNIQSYLQVNVNKKINHYIFYTFPTEVAGKFKVDEIIKITKNNKDEIISVDYQMDNIYVLLSDSLTVLYNNINDIKFNINYFEEGTDILWIPLGVGSENIFITNFGPKIPIKLNLLIDVGMGYKTKVTNYGINNILIELYLVVNVKNSMLTPVTQESFGESYEVLIASRIITGNVPDYYNGILENNSPIVNS